MFTIEKYRHVSGSQLEIMGPCNILQHGRSKQFGKQLQMVTSSSQSMTIGIRGEICPSVQFGDHIYAEV